MLHERDLVGTARYVGLSGAMTAVGGDASAVALNPAGLGVYRRMELSASLDIATERIPDINMKKTTASLSQVSYVFAIPSSGRSQVVSNNFMIGYQRVRTFDRQVLFGFDNEPVSLADVAAIKTNGLYPQELRHEDRWNRGLNGGEPAGWLSLLAFDNYLIDPLLSDSSRWVTPLMKGETVNHTTSSSERGSINEFSFTWGMNVAHRLYVGLGTNIRSLNYSKRSIYSERLSDNRSIQNESSMSVSGVGFNATVGFIYRPCQYLRLGASLQTPSVASFTMYNNGEMTSNLAPDKKETRSSTPYNSVRYRNFIQPLRFSVGVATQLRNFGLLSLQYDLEHEKYMSKLHTLHVGIEGVILDRVMLDLGYAFQSDFLTSAERDQKAYDTYYLPYNAYRTDTDYHTRSQAHIVGAGVGYHSNWWTIHVAYQYRLQPLTYYAHEVASAYDMKSVAHRVVLTLNWHTKN